MASSAPVLGTVVLGELALEEQLGSSVYRARRTRDGRELTMRIVHPRTSQEGAEFLTLAATASRVRHPALASVEAYGRLDTERCFIASELVGGQRLDEWADAIGIPPLAQVIELVRRLCVGLQAAARAGVVHDAIHARNVRVQSMPKGSNARMQVKLLGLGVPALLFDYRQDAEALRFMAPEELQVLSRPELPATFRCSAQMNVYSCGALLYYLATGGTPYGGSSAPELLIAHSGAPLVPPARINPQITPGLNAVVMRALELDPSDRFASAAELGEALAAVSGSVSPSGRRSDAPPERPVSSERPIADEAFGPEPPTFRTSVSEIAALERVAGVVPTSVRANDVTPEKAEAHDKPTLPPVPRLSSAPPLPPQVKAEAQADAQKEQQPFAELRDSVSGVAPIGLFSSSPPHLRPSMPGEVTNAGAPKPTPLAAFSEPPRMVGLEAPLGGGPALVPGSRESGTAYSAVSRPSAPPNRLSEPERARPRMTPWPMLALPLAAAVCVIAFFSVRVLLGPDRADKEKLVAALPTSAAPSAPSAPSAPTQLAPRPSDEQPEQDEADAIREAAHSQQGAAVPPRGYMVPGEEAEERPEHESFDPQRHRGGRRGGPPPGPRHNNAPASAPPAAAAPQTLPAAAAAPLRGHGSQALVDEHIDEPVIAPNPPPGVDPALGARPKIDEHEASPSVVIPAPEPVASVPREPAPRAERAASESLSLAATVKIDGVEVRGSLPTSQVRHAVERLSSQLKRCYDSAAQAAGHNAFGELIVAVEIDERGRAKSPMINAVHGASLPRLEGCVTDAVQHLITGRVPDTGIVSATWKVVFMP